MSSTIILIIAFTGFLFLVGFLVFKISNQRKDPDSQTKEMDYRTFFILGLIFLGAGAALSISTGEFYYNGLSALGLVYLITGVANQSKWKK